MTTPESSPSQRLGPERAEPQPHEPPSPESPFLTLHAAVVLVVAVLVGFTAGGLSHLGGVPTALSVLAGLGAAGASVPVLRGLIR